MSKVVKHLPLVVVLGATGVGKSKLAIEICQKFGGEIISADSMQIYKGLDIVTNKVTEEEQRLVQHHMLDFISPLTKNYTVVDFRNKALSIINNLLEMKKLPVIVGGTNYYIEALLWNFLTGKPTVPNEGVEASTVPVEGIGSFLYRKELQDNSTSELYSKLKSLDGASALKIHPKDRRKIIRALEVEQQLQTPLSCLLEAQHQETGATTLSGALRYPNTCIIWVQCDQQVLDARIDKRVDDMISAGLLEELQAFHSQYNQYEGTGHGTPDNTLGIFQSIGFKEFQDYLTLSQSEQQSPEGQKALQAGIERMKLVTRRYARKQKKWITSRFLQRRGTMVPPLYPVNSTDVAQWQEEVHEPCMKIVQHFIDGTPLHLETLPQQGPGNSLVYNNCQVCDVVCITLKEWQAHVKGKKHRFNMKKLVQDGHMSSIGHMVTSSNDEEETTHSTSTNKQDKRTP